MKKRAFYFLICLGLILTHFFVPIQAEEEEYQLLDYSNGASLVETYSSFQQARRGFEEKKDQYNNLGIFYQGQVLQVEYGIVLFHSSEGCDVNVEFVYEDSGTQGYTNGCYGIDGAYLETSNDGNQVRFLLSNADGWASIEDMTIVPIEQLEYRLSAYTVTNNKLFHEIKTTMEDDNYSSIIDFGEAPEYLQDGENYYSYDGHYFYQIDSLWLMLDDYQNGIRWNSVNPEQPFYDYYQFVSHRTLTNVTVEEANGLFSESSGVHSTINFYQDDDKDSVNDNYSQSQYYGNLDSFWQYQYEFGANALMMLALSSNESAQGRSSLSYTRNNLFGHAAYDSDVEANASRYFDMNHSVYSHAKYYISGSYCSPLKFQYHGGYFGNKTSGMNVSYASDPYWGEKAAENYRKYDEKFGGKDKDAYAIAIKTSASSIPIYKSPSWDSASIYHTGQYRDFAFVVKNLIQREDELWYEILCDATLDDSHEISLDYYFDESKQSAYIRASDIDIFLEGKNNYPHDYYEVIADGDGGEFYGDGSLVRYHIPVGQKASLVSPKKDHAIFTSWDQEIPDTLQAGETLELRAVYQDVNSIEMHSIPKQQYEYQDRIVLKGGEILVHYADHSEVLPITTSMVSGYDFTQPGDQEVIVEYAGCQTSYSIHVSQELDDLRTEIREHIYALIEEYHENGSLPESRNDEILALKKQIDENMLPYLTQAQLRDFDTIVRNAMGEQIRYQIEKNPYDLQVSGLSISIPLEDSFEKRKYLEDTYRISIDQGISSHAKDRLSTQATQLDSNVEDEFEISLFKNYEEYELSRPIILSIQKPDTYEDGDVYTVLYYDEENEEVLKCYTRQSKSRIHFMSKGLGNYMLVSRKTSNLYLEEDPIESLNEDTRSTDVEQYRVWMSVASLGLLVVLLIARKLWKKKQERNYIEHKQEETPIVHEHDIVDELTQALELYETQIIQIQSEDKKDD